MPLPDTQPPEVNVPPVAPDPLSETDVKDSPGFASVLRNRNFLVLWSGQIFSQLADKIYLVLMIALIAEYFHHGGQGIGGWVSAIMIASTIPAILFGSLAGVYVDRWSKKRVLVVTNLLRGGLVLSLPLALWLGEDGMVWEHIPLNFWFLLGITFFVSTLTQFFAPAEQAVLPLMVSPRDLLAANSLYTTTMMVLLIVGFAVGEPLLGVMANLFHHLHLLPEWGKETLVGGAYTIAGVLLLFLKTGETREHRASDHSHPFEDIRDGMRYLASNHRVRNALIQLVILFSVFAALAVIAVSLATRIPGLKADQFGFLLATGGLGMGLGAIWVGRGPRLSHAQLGLLGSLGMAICLLGLTLTVSSLWLSLLAIAALGFFASLVGVPMQTTIQAETPPAMRGKVFGLQNNAVNIALSLPLALAGIAETLFGLNTVLIVLSLLAIVGGILTWLLSHQKIATHHHP